MSEDSILFYSDYRSNYWWERKKTISHWIVLCSRVIFTTGHYSIKLGRRGHVHMLVPITTNDW